MLVLRATQAGLVALALAQGEVGLESVQDHAGL